ncbi:MAG: neutral/alkaline non-lysosomal ceramidase C-terminal domain-containing protein [Panacagrimonas sp.]
MERQAADGSWIHVATDRDPELIFDWRPQLGVPLPIDSVTGPSTADARWTIRRDTPAGTYRLRHEGVARTAVLPAMAYSGVSSPFTVSGPVSDCP